jgi:nucleoside-diphosphate-sugar epimerase
VSVRETVLVTGGCGYVGSCLVPRLLDAGYSVRVIDTGWFGDHLTRSKELEVVLGDVRSMTPVDVDGVGAIIHLANIANDPGVELNPTLSWEVNVLGTQHLLDLASRAGVRQFMYASSGSVYGVKDEDRVTEDLPLVPISTYNKTKMVAERVCASYTDVMAVHSIRPATVCGFSPRMRLDVSVNMLTMQAYLHGRVTVFGGAQTRPNIHIGDLCDVYLHFLANPHLPSGAYNAGFENMSIMAIAELVSKYRECEVVVSESNDPRSYRQDSSRLLSTGFQPTRSVEQAIREMLEKWEGGGLTDDDSWYTVKRMKQLGL